MKKLIIIIVLLIGGITLAQKGENGNRERMKDLSPEQVATLQVKKTTLALDLTKTQQTQMHSFFEEKAKVRKAHMVERKAQKENGEAKKLTSEERYTRANQRLDHQIAEKAKLKEILSEEQLDKWQKMQKRKGKSRKAKGRKKKENKNR